MDSRLPQIGSHLQAAREMACRQRRPCLVPQASISHQKLQDLHHPMATLRMATFREAQLAQTQKFMRNRDHLIRQFQSQTIGAIRGHQQPRGEHLTNLHIEMVQSNLNRVTQIHQKLPRHTQD